MPSPYEIRQRRHLKSNVVDVMLISAAYIVLLQILFIGSGAFQNCKPSDLLAELQGRLPIRVELKALTQQDLYRILTEPKHNPIQQQIELMQTEGSRTIDTCVLGYSPYSGVSVKFTDASILEIARVAAEVNRYGT